MEQENQLQIFNNEEFGQVRTLKIGDKDYFVGIDIASALGYKEPRKAISRHCKHGTKHPIEVITGVKTDGSDAIQEIETTIIPEGDMYRLITKSQLPSAEKFEEWVMDDVLPTLRKKGYYNLHNNEENTNDYLKIEPSKLEQKAIELFENINDKTSELGEYFRPKHKTKLAFNKFIKDCLGDNATKENCKKAKDMFIMILGNGEYTIYEDIPLEKIKNTNALATLYDICKNINLSINKGIEIK